MRYSRTKLGIVFILLFFCGTFLPSSLFAQTQGRSVSPPTFPQCSNKMSSPGDRKHETDGTHKVSGHEDIDGSRDLYTLTDGNFVECTCPQTGDTGIQTIWWYINGLPLGKVDIDAYTRDGWNSENGSEWDLLDGQYLAKTEDFSCKARTASNAAMPSSTRTPTPRVTRPANDTPTPTEETDQSNNNDESLPDTGLPFGVVIGIVSMSGIGFYLRKHFLIQ
jgi:hypothetical protein